MEFGWQQGVLLLLIAASAASAGRTLSRKLSWVAAGAPDRPRTQNWGRRLGITLREVLLQTRVIGGRPVVGALHAVVFFGFVLFGFETLDHFAHGFHGRLLEPLLGPLYPAYRGLMIALAVLVSLAIIGLAFRRFVLVKSSPDPKSLTSGLVALFILVLMLTYLNGVRETPFAPVSNWWLHALVILAFPSLILKSKHFHILLSPVAIFLRLERLGDYAPIDLEKVMAEEAAPVALGLETVRDLPWKMRLDFLTCVECRRCTDNCPSARAGNVLDPRGFILSGRQAMAAEDPGQAAVGPQSSPAPPVISDEALATCVTCGACEHVCPVGIEHLQVLLGAKRAQALASGRGVVAVDFFHAIESTGNALSRPQSDRKSLLVDLDLPRLSTGEDRWLLWLGCIWGYNRDQRPAVAALKKLLERAGVPYGVLEEEICCGHHSRRQGEEVQYQDLARRTMELLQEKKINRILTPCPHCLHTIKREYSQLGEWPEPVVVHHSEFLAGLVAEGRLPLRPGNGEQAVYHDPCYLARFEGQTAAPREVLAAAGLALRPLPHQFDRTLCCGGGAAGFVREIKDGKRVDQPRREEIAAAGSTLLVTSCPECRMMLDASVERTQDIAEALASALEA